jgi:para-aminobenzoate synthetase component 1
VGAEPEWSVELCRALDDAGEARGGFALGPLRSGMGREAFEDAVATAVEYIRAGDIFQVSLSHRMSGAFAGSTRALFRALIASAGPRHGAYLEVPDGSGGPPRAVVSVSPELFLSFDAPTRLVTTRPMKGTRPASAGAGVLEASGKDRAELAMIVDLMRNDLGRVCEFGSIRVAEPRVIERHGAERGGVYQGVATVQGRLREGLDTADLLGATFPGGSVTGAPKIRAMQIIEELEPVARGPYCGAIGMVSDSGDALLSIAIRTALVSGGRLDYSVGAGIVAESEPGAEWAETLDKARGIMDLAGAGSPGPESLGAAPSRSV